MGSTNIKNITIDAGRLLIFMILFSEMTLSVISHQAALAVQGVSLTLFALYLLGKRKLKISSFAIWYSFFVTIVAISCLLLTKEFDNSFLNMLQLLVVFVFLDQYVEDRKTIENVFNAYIICCLILGTWLMMKSYVANDARLGTSVSESLPIWIGSFSSISFCFCIFLSVLHNSSKHAKRLYLIVASYSFVILFLSGSRKYYLSIIGSLFFYITNFNKGRTRRLLIALTVSIIFLFLIYNNDYMYSVLGRRIDKLINYTATHDINDDKSAAVRAMFARTAWEAFLEKPFFGHGMWSWNRITRFGTHPHNNYLDLLFSLGVFGFVYYYSFLVRILVSFSSRKRQIDANVKKFWIISIATMLIMDWFQRSYAFDPVFLFFAFAFWESYRMPTLESPDLMGTLYDKEAEK